MKIAAALLLSAAGMVAACSSDGCPPVAAPEPTAAQRVLLDPSSDALRATPPDIFHLLLTTSVGDVDIEVIRAWAPLGAARLYNLARNGFFDGNRFFRVLPGFVAQFGVSPVPAIQAAWNQAPLSDEPVRVSNLRGTLVFAKAGPDSRTTQLFINYLDNPQLDALGFTPVGRVVNGLSGLVRLYGGYGETRPQGNGPAYACMLQGGEAYLAKEYSRLDRIERAEVRE